MHCYNNFVKCCEAWLTLKSSNAISLPNLVKTCRNAWIPCKYVHDGEIKYVEITLALDYWYKKNMLSNQINQQRKNNTPYRHFIAQIVGLVQERRNSIANALELQLYCTNPSRWCGGGDDDWWWLRWQWVGDFDDDSDDDNNNSTDRCCEEVLLTVKHSGPVSISDKYSLLMHCIKIKSPAKFLLNEQYVFLGWKYLFSLCAIM